jgi:hypothetical protein
MIAQASTNLDAGIVANDFGGVVISQIREKVCAAERDVLAWRNGDFGHLCLPI